MNSIPHKLQIIRKVNVSAMERLNDQYIILEMLPNAEQRILMLRVYMISERIT